MTEPTVYGWTWVDAESDDGDWYILITDLSEPDTSGERYADGEEIATILCRNYEQVKTEHPEWIEAKERHAGMIVDALNRASYTREDLQKVAADARTPYAKTQMANLAKLTQLIEDAEAKYAEYADLAWRTAEQEASCSYWMGVRDGLRRAVNVLEGRG